MFKRVGIMLTAALLVGGAAPVMAQEAAAFPTKRVTIVVPFPAGAGPDVVRFDTIDGFVSDHLGQML